ncbi:MAG TPA: hypothetical protein VJT49_00945 [Amycolatopsis sp.]|uniref:WXG100 family type VII secretion target n=1 Tax=Amycolatopsis sp. TaxID=37632 RepID=UPI002B48AB43|nr:hypothetical protein [Amycolatopsis sp.]HKS43682.1 hypothetical protein [Amycolatopsis sp.]
MEFSVRWSDGLDVLTDDAGQIADALSRVSNAYRAVDEAAARTMPNDPGLGPSTMAELGETQDPQALVPGKPEAIEENARILRTRAGRAGDAADGLRAIDTGGAWQGPAARAFHDKFSYEPSKWFAAADSSRSGQPVRLDGKPGSKPESHIPCNPDGTYPLPEGW